jgi:protein-S-isoprenylcysteine O-methyltransferase Ste14
MSETRAKLVRGVQTVVVMVVWIAGLFLGAGTLDWPRGWISAAVYCVGMGAASILVSRINPEVAAARSKWRRKDTKGFDKVILGILLPLATLQPVVAGLDAVRFEWWPLPSFWLWPAIVVFALAMVLITWTLAVNRHAETTVRIQTDRGHQVVTTGPYRFVRHPMYAGALLMYLATPLIWASGAAMLVSLAIIGLLVWRTVLEDRTLQRELPGYADFARRTVYRLIPGLW